MKFMATWSIRPGCMPEATSKFLSGKAEPGAGITVLGRWHKADGSGGFTLSESDDPAAMCAFSLIWADVLEIHSSMVIDDAQAGPLIVKNAQE